MNPNLSLPSFHIPKLFTVGSPISQSLLYVLGYATSSYNTSLCSAKQMTIPNGGRQKSVIHDPKNLLILITLGAHYIAFSHSMPGRNNISTAPQLKWQAVPANGKTNV